jgi:hypothetical protein
VQCSVQHWSMGNTLRVSRTVDQRKWTFSASFTSEERRLVEVGVRVLMTPGDCMCLGLDISFDSPLDSDSKMFDEVISRCHRENSSVVGV